MEIKFFGHSTFLISGRNAKILTDPLDPSYTFKSFEYQNVPAIDIITVSHDHKDHNFTDPFVGGNTVVLNNPGEYEIKEILITGTQTFHDESGGEERGENTVFEIMIDGIKIVHMGDFGEKFSKDILEKLPSEIDILMIPVGGVYTIGPESAKKIVEEISPKIVIPMHFAEKDLLFDLSGVEKFLSNFEGENVEEKGNSFKIKNGKIPESTKIYVMTR